jgi:hypothetical protein
MDYDFMADVEYATAKKERNAIIMAHARFPTRGGVSLEETHPHVVDHIMGMHNGTLSKVNNKAVPKDASDSRLFFEEVAAKGIEVAVKKAEGAYALTWTDDKAGTISFLRNEHRPLFFGHYEHDTGTVLWASEAGMLEFVLSRHRGQNQGKVVIKGLAPDHMVSFPLSPRGMMKPVVRKLSPKTTNVVPLLPGPTKPDASQDKNIPMPFGFLPTAKQGATPLRTRRPSWTTTPRDTNQPLAYVRGVVCYPRKRMFSLFVV